MTQHPGTNPQSSGAVLLSPGQTELASHRPMLTLLLDLAKACGVDISPVAAQRCLYQIERDLPGAWSETWSQRLVECGRDLGLRITVSRLSLEEALHLARPDRPLATLIGQQNGSLGSLVLLEEKGRSCQIRESPTDSNPHWLKIGEVRERLQQQPTSSPTFLWLTADPLTPCQPLEEAGDEEEVHEHHGPPPWTRLRELLRKDRSDIRVIILFSLGVGIFSLSIPIAVESIVATVQGGAQILLQPVIALALILFAFLMIAAFLRVMKAFVVEYLQQRIFVRVTADLAWRLPKARVESFDRHHGPELANRFFDVLTVQKASATLLTEGLSVTIQTILGLLLLAFYNPYLLGFDVLLLLAFGFIIFVLGRGGVRTSIQESHAKYKVAGWLEEMVRHPLSFKMSGGSSLALERADLLAREYVKARRSHFRIVFRQVLFTLMLQAIASAALLALGGWLVINRGLTLGQLVAAELIVITIVGSFVKFGKSLESYYDLMAGTDKLGHLIDLPLERLTGEAHHPRDSHQGASLRAYQLCFEYQEEHRPVLTNLSFAIRPGERIAIVGPHGSGKSTLIDILYGLREPQAGFIELDGVDIREIKPEALRAHVVTAKGLEVFDGTVIDNVRMGRHFISLAEVREALRRVHLLEEIQKFPTGLQTRLSPGGNPLSIGQARRLMLARAIAGHPRLLLIDEAFDFVHEDVREHLLVGFLDSEAPWTLLAVTHSPHVASRCDRVIHLPRGDVEENHSQPTDSITNGEGPDDGLDR